MHDKEAGRRHAIGGGATLSPDCPICGAVVSSSTRYPRPVCASCTTRACSLDGRLLTFFNLGFDGGYGASFVDDGEPYVGHDCLIDGVRCWADEARFGGIVIEVKA